MTLAKNSNMVQRNDEIMECLGVIPEISPKKMLCETSKVSHSILVAIDYCVYVVNSWSRLIYNPIAPQFFTDHRLDLISRLSQ